jgi:hypothetical protein
MSWTSFFTIPQCATPLTIQKPLEGECAAGAAKPALNPRECRERKAFLRRPDSLCAKVQFAADPLERPALDMEGAPYPGDRIHRLHPLSIRSKNRTDGRRTNQ